jgi:predicted dehydrogenase
MIRVGMVGAGFWTDLVQLPAFQKISGFEVIAITSARIENARRVAARFRIQNVYQTYAELVKDPSVDVVNICVPNWLHKEIALAAFREGKDVICIKPLAHTLQGAQEMVRAAKESGRQLLYAENVPFIPALTRLKEMVAAGMYGDLFRLKACEGIGRTHAPWFSDPAQSGGGCIIDMAVHGLSFLLWMAADSRPVRVNAEAGTFVHEQKVEDTSVITIRFENGIIGQTEDSWSLTGGFDSRFELYGTKGHAMVELLYGHPIRSVLGGAMEGGGNVLHLHAVDDHFVKDGHLAMFTHFGDCLTSKGPCRSDGATGLRIMELVDAAYRSLAERRTISLQNISIVSAG